MALRAANPCSGSLAPLRRRRSCWDRRRLRQWLRLTCVGLCASVVLQAHGHACHRSWPAWEQFKRQFVSEDGRVIDSVTSRRHSTSEGQSYALFLALVANDRSAFDRVLVWTQNNLAGGDLTRRLPGWQWGQSDDGAWRLLDANSASDADLWLVFALAEAGRLWDNRRHSDVARSLAQRVLHEEVAHLPGLGPVLLPGAAGFGPEIRDGRLQARLNPSYMPLPVLRRLASIGESPLWQAIADSSAQVLMAASSSGFAPDWLHYAVEVAPGTNVLRGQPVSTQAKATLSLSESPDQQLGSYDAIRVYLWLGMTSPDDPHRAPLMARLTPMLEWIDQHGAPPEHWHLVKRTAQGEAPPGFSAAVLPFLTAAKRSQLLVRQRHRLHSMMVAQGPSTGTYYDQVLALFGQGFVDQRFRFERDGALVPAWLTCTIH